MKMRPSTEEGKTHHRGHVNTDTSSHARLPSVTEAGERNAAFTQYSEGAPVCYYVPHAAPDRPMNH